MFPQRLQVLVEEEPQPEDHLHILKFLLLGGVVLLSMKREKLEFGTTKNESVTVT